MRLHSQRRRAVTLTEIVVVTAIIGILAGLSFSAFTAAKNFADQMPRDVQAAFHRVNKNNKSRGLPDSVPGVTRKPRPTWVPGQYYVGFRGSVANPHQEAHRLAGLVGGSVLSVYTNVIHGFGLKCDATKIAAIVGDPAVSVVDQVRYVYPCAAPMNIQRVYSNGLHYSQTSNPATYTNMMFGAPTSVYRFYRNTTRGIGTTRLLQSASSGQSITVAIMDTGIDKTHPDLFVVGEHDFTGGGNPADADGHGTHVAGVVAAADSTSAGGVVGVYPGGPLLNLKVMTNNAGDSLPAGNNLFVYNALNYVINNAAGIGVCLMPFETTQDSPMNALVNAAANSGVLMIAAAGNGSGADISTVSPASASQAIAVGALIDTDGLPGGFGGGSDDTIAGYSNIGALAFLAPGGSSSAYLINSTIPLAGQILNGLSSPYSTEIFGTSGNDASGTSFAAAHVAGMMALVRDPQTNMGFVLGGGRGVTSFRLDMTNRAAAVAGLRNLTHQSMSFQMISPLTGSAWLINPITRAVTPYRKSLYGGDVINGIPVPNFYINAKQQPSNLPQFPG